MSARKRALPAEIASCQYSARPCRGRRQRAAWASPPLQERSLALSNALTWFRKPSATLSIQSTSGCPGARRVCRLGSARGRSGSGSSRLP